MTHTSNMSFPHELLKQPIRSRLSYFQSRVFAHPRLVEIDKELTTAIRYPADAALIFVYGPTGVGKTTMRLRVEKRLVEQVLPELSADHDRVPYVSIEADAPETGNFNWKDYYRKAFLALGESPELVERKMPIWKRGEYATLDRLNNLFRVHTHATELRHALFEALRYRRPLAFLIDEGQHMTKVAGGRVLADHMDHLKSLANTSGTVHVLFGTYQLATLARLSGQLSRRSIGIHFRRYQYDAPDDLQAFQSVLHTFQSHLPLPHPSDLLKDQEFMYEICSGCVGTLKGWIDRALALALEAGDKSLKRKHVERVVDGQRVVQIAREVTEGERILGDDSSHRTELRQLLGLSPASTPTRCIQHKASKRGPIGRKAKRDRVGVRAEVGMEVARA